jgi:hypothetical protein
MTFADWISILVTIAFVLNSYLYNLQEKRHKDEIERIHDSYKEERQELLDRIMANNITEYKTARSEANVTRSPNSNFLKDRMTKAAQDYVDFDQ